MGVRECGAGRSRTVCGNTSTGSAKVYVVRCSSATRIVTRVNLVAETGPDIRLAGTETSLKRRLAHPVACPGGE